MNCVHWQPVHDVATDVICSFCRAKASYRLDLPLHARFAHKHASVQARIERRTNITLEHSTHGLLAHHVDARRAHEMCTRKHGGGPYCTKRLTKHP